MLTQLIRKFLASPSSRARRPTQRISAVAAVEQLESRQLLAVSGIKAFHRSGQTFLTWNEDTTVTGEGYHVYRSKSPITTANLASASKLTSRWGALDDATSVNVRAATSAGVPVNLVINPQAAPLSDNTGLFVYTAPAGASGTWYYAVTQVTNGTENLTVTAGASSLSVAVSELVATPQPVLTVSNASGKGRIYTQYMDYAQWNPTFQGYAYNYSVALPSNYTTTVAWPLKVIPHAYGERMRMEQQTEYDWQCIQLFLDDAGGGAPGDRFFTWWYGFAADHNYRTDGPVPSSGRIENFTEQRILRTVDEVSSLFKVDRQRIHAEGHSMGASGSLSLGIRYGNVFAGIFGSEPMTNYATSPQFQPDYTSLWGTQASNLPIVSNGPWATHLKPYDGTGVYDWMNHPQQLLNRRGEPMAFLMVGHGKADDIIDWETQGQPFIAALNAGNVGYSAEQREGWDHNWMSFGYALESMMSPGIGGLGKWQYLRDMSFPGISGATNSGPESPALTGTDFYNTDIEWSVPWNHFGADIIDQAFRYEITLRSTTTPQIAEVTPQRRQLFTTPPGTMITWTNTDVASGAVVQSGTVTADADGLFTLPRVSIGLNAGNRLVLTALARPALTAPAATTVSMTPLITWSATASTRSYDVFVQNMSTGEVPIQKNVTTTSLTPSVALGIGRFRVWVRSRFLNGDVSGWSAFREFRILTPAVMTPLTSPVYSATPTLSWNAQPGAVTWEVSLSNVTTGQNDIIRQSGIAGTSWQVTASLGLGVYKAWVRGIDAAGLPGGWSAAMQFRAAAPVILNGPRSPGFSTRPVFDWQTLAGANRYEISLKNLKTGATAAAVAGLTSASWTPATNLPTGDYRWWVRGSSTVSGIVGAWSLPMDFNVGGRPVLKTPVGSTDNRRPLFTWSAVTDAIRYELWVDRADGTASVVRLSDLTSPAWTPDQDLEPYTYRVWVRAVSAAGVFSDWSLRADFTVT